MLEVRTNDSFAELLVDGEFVASTVDVELIHALPRLAHKLGFEYAVTYGEWTREHRFVPRRC